MMFKHKYKHNGYLPLSQKERWKCWVFLYGSGSFPPQASARTSCTFLTSVRFESTSAWSYDRPSICKIERCMVKDEALIIERKILFGGMTLVLVSKFDTI